MLGDGEGQPGLHLDTSRVDQGLWDVAEKYEIGGKIGLVATILNWRKIMDLAIIWTMAIGLLSGDCLLIWHIFTNLAITGVMDPIHHPC